MFTTMVAQQKAKLPFYLYAYCLMPNHSHLLIERQDDKISRIMQGLLTGYSQYFNRKYKTSIEDLLNVAARSSGLSRQELCSKSKNRRTVAVRDAVIVLGRERGISNRELAEALGVDGSSVTNRVEVARVRGLESVELKRLRKAVKPGARVKAQ